MQLGDPRRIPGTAPCDDEQPIPQPVYQYTSTYRHTCTDCRTDMPPGSLVTVHGPYAGPVTTRRIQCPECAGSRP
ncbi:hypothetical protein B5566_02575 [Mycobacterium sp. MHSD3]|nr:hypothetical protein B5566_02575 [Mycobacterium sp. MHSD3]